MPPVTGEMISQAIRAAYSEPIPILLVTADGRAPEKARRARAFDFLMKPFELEDLIQAVNRGLRGTT
ncbi:MAG: response regulator [Chloroflexi bacterium]|nr:response regulator [Chloroflexota bacterium]